MSKLLKNFVGIDISKPYFDAAVIKADDPYHNVHNQFPQSSAGFKKMVTWLRGQDVLLNNNTLLCMEYTGIYNSGLVNFLVEQKAQLWVEMPLRINKSSGFERGSDDKTSAIKIAAYAYRYQDKMQLWRPVDSNVQKIKHLNAQRDRVVKAITQLTVPLEELSACGCHSDAKQLEKLQQTSLKALKKTKEAIEQLIKKTIAQDATIAKKIKQAKSIKGIGQVTAVAVLGYTRGFTSFSEGNQLSCYCGVVPFGKISGTSVRTKPTVSHHANKKLKKLFHLCALSAIRYDKEIRAYFERKLAEGKNKMCVINAVRNKLVRRLFAVIRDDRLYEENYVRKCA